MLWYSNAKPQLFHIAKCKSSADVRRVLALIEKHGRNIRNRTALSSEEGHGSKKFPVKILPRRATGLVLDYISDIEGNLPLGFIKNLTAAFFENAMRVIPGIRRMSFEIKITLKKAGMRHLRVQLLMLERKWFLGFEFYGHPKDPMEAEDPSSG